MKRSFFTVAFLAFFVFDSNLEAQTRRRFPPKAKNQATAQPPNKAVVIDERLAVLRAEPSFHARPLMRMRNGRQVSISASREADGVTFYRVAAPPNNYGWVQAEAVFGRFRRGDDARLAQLVQSSEGFEQIERAQTFLEFYNDSALRPAMLLLFGDLVEETALKLSAEATRRLDRREMAASGAPLHSFYLNYVSLDRYRRLGINFLFNSNAKSFHYDGASWREIIRKSPKSAEAVEAQKRLESLKAKIERMK